MSGGWSKRGRRWSICRFPTRGRRHIWKSIFRDWPARWRWFRRRNGRAGRWNWAATCRLRRCWNGCAGIAKCGARTTARWAGPIERQCSCRAASSPAIVDHFDAERDRFPYPDEYFDVVVAGEIIEHLTADPMHMLLEARRVLCEGGFLLLTTPNAGSITSVAKTLDGRDNPQVFFLYKRPRPGEEPEIGHVREYTAFELGETVKAAGFEVKQLFTTFIEEFSSHLPLLKFLEENGYDTENRGEQTWCLAVKRSSLAVNRYPYFIYSE